MASDRARELLADVYREQGITHGPPNDILAGDESPDAARALIAIDTAFSDGELRERARIVEWLRKKASDLSSYAHDEEASQVDICADSIERGDHLSSEDGV
jgi:hypothetical protein